ncbi:hypothetical protein M011DRAFT_472637 [Sporormia fimetaria CBS 119925]|uniref:DUF7492 domain-containing protein n=1 Tax=Sporormia fimetaria CBS 119925 TaxID=1340428 RepID=A0A6A6UVX3_9PLEO|nr:hypothetical protein M011DRAFT_472637 [Sporormia fimetaria CBS 119925]
MLKASANDTVLLMYQENGHVTKLDPNHRTSGKTVVYGLLNASSNDKLLGFNVSTKAVGTEQWSKFDDGSCYEDNGSPIAQERKSRTHRSRMVFEGNNLWCGHTIRLPQSLRAGDIYTLYWVWVFNGMNHHELYTTCLDLQIVC